MFIVYQKKKISPHDHRNYFFLFFLFYSKFFFLQLSSFRVENPFLIRISKTEFFFSLFFFFSKNETNLELIWNFKKKKKSNNYNYVKIIMQFLKCYTLRKLVRLVRIKRNDHTTFCLFFKVQICFVPLNIPM